MTFQVSSFKFQEWWLALFLFGAMHAGFGESLSGLKAPRAALVAESSLDVTFAANLAEDAQQAGYAVDRLSYDQIVVPQTWADSPWDLLIVPDARHLPVEAMPLIERFLKNGSDILALGLPAWDQASWRLDGRWLSRQEYEQILSQQRPTHSLFNFATEDLSRWKLATDNPKAGAVAEVQTTPDGPAFHARIQNLISWNVWVAPDPAQPFPSGHSLTCFRAKGGPRTRALAIEWIEEDGSRWIATATLSEQWKDYVLAPEAFRPWESIPGRGGAGDKLNVRKARRFTVGVAFSHGTTESGAHEFWLANMGTAPNPLGDSPLPSEVNVPHLETLSPGYLFYPVHGPVLLEADNDAKAWLSEAEVTRPPETQNTRSKNSRLNLLAGVAVPKDLLAMHPRPRGVGFAQNRPWRWQPLLVARSLDGDFRGAIASLLVRTADAYRGGIWASFTPTDPAFYEHPAIRSILRRTMGRIRDGLFLHEGGSEFFTAFENQPLRLGAQVAHLGGERAPMGGAGAVDCAVRLRVVDPLRPGQIAMEKTWSNQIPPQSACTNSIGWMPTSWPSGGYEVTVDLLRGTNLIDRLSHELHVWQPAANPKFIEAREGGFWLDGKPWKAHGVNYMPASGIGVASEYFEYWLGRGAYDPEVIERDLRRIKAMNLNSVSIFIYHRSLDAQHLLDFLRRCSAHGLRVNQSLRPGTPLDFRWIEMKALIEHYRLAQHDTVFAYDLAWEPSHYDQRYQQSYTPAWSKWIVRRHGSLDAAQKAWGVSAPQDKNGSLSVPPMRWLMEDGAWRKIAADYRAFLDEMLAQKYAEARRLVQSIDRRHPISFRMQMAGDPTHLSEGLLPYDFYGLANAVDIWEPEAYGRIGDWARVKPGAFTVAYARLCDPSKPVLWAEMGTTVWDHARMAPNQPQLAFAARYYADFYRMLTLSGSDGVFFWWYPGGYRLNEKSDYGIINPDGTDRPVTRVIRAEGPKFMAAPKPALPDTWIEVDRDADARGLFGIYEKAKGQFWQAIETGKKPALKWSAR